MCGARVGVGGLWHETNTYGPRPADLTAFQDFELLEADAVVARHAGTRSVIGGFLDHDGFDLVPLFSAGAWPSGPAPAVTLELLLDRFIGQLRVAGPLDGLLLNLHGAMVAEGCADVEAELLDRIRAQAPDVPIAAVLDLHANPSPAFVGHCDVVLCYDTYPHVDMWERGQEAAGWLAEAIAGRRFVTVLAKTPLLVGPLAQATDAEPMRGLISRAGERAAVAGVVRAGITPGFAYSDVERAGVSALVVADADQVEAARGVAAAIVADVEAHAARFALARPDVAAAVDSALAATGRPVVLADVADNIGGGSAGDGTALLRELLDRRAADAVVVIADPQVAAQAAATGAGATLQVRLGGKLDRLHGEPIEAAATVVRVTDGNYTTSGTWMQGQSFAMGTTAVLDLGGVQVVVTERATPPFHREQLTSVGIDPARVGIIVAKGAVAWRAAYPDARTVIEVATPGACPVDVTQLPRRTTPMRVL